MARILIADSGSTKTQWTFLNKKGKPVHFRTSGINPYLQSSMDILKMLQDEFPKKALKETPESVSFYGAGVGTVAQEQTIATVLNQFFQTEKSEVKGDMLAAARALSGDKKGVVCILGTGSNACYYDGKKIAQQQPSLGYIAGDEGSGNHMGKRILQYYAYQTFDPELRASFELLFGNNLNQIIQKLYKEPFPNRFLASFVPLLIANRGHFMVENIVEDCLSDFFLHHILKYRQSWKYPIHFCGSIAYEFRDVLISLCHQYELDPGNISKSPMDGLIRYHRSLM